jgi:hypothetical protein
MIVDDCATTLKEDSINQDELLRIDTHSAGDVHTLAFVPGCCFSNVLQNMSAALGTASHTRYGTRSEVVFGPRAKCFENRFKAILEPI